MFSSMDADEEAPFSSCIHGYHFYNVIWSATLGEELECSKKLEMRYAISILQGPHVSTYVST